jgi:hypothetical protein
MHVLRKPGTSPIAGVAEPDSLRAVGPLESQQWDSVIMENVEKRYRRAQKDVEK